MMMFTKAIEKKLAASDRSRSVMKIFNPYGGQTWVIFGYDEDGEHRNPDVLYCVADLGFQCVEAGSVLRSELEDIRIKIGGYGLPLERDTGYDGGHTVAELIEMDTLAGLGNPREAA